MWGPEPVLPFSSHPVPSSLLQVSHPTDMAQSPAICPTPSLGRAIVTALDITAGGSVMSQGPIVAMQGGVLLQQRPTLHPAQSY